MSGILWEDLARSLNSGCGPGYMLAAFARTLLQPGKVRLVLSSLFFRKGD
jgi:hypothetical protein